MKKFSIIIPHYNEAKKLGVILWRLAHCKTPKEEFEVILVDEGSEGGRFKKLIKHFSAVLNIIHLNTHTGGHLTLACARNLGLRCSVAPYTVFLKVSWLPSESMIKELDHIVKEGSFVCGSIVNFQQNVNYYREHVFFETIGDKPIYQFPIKKIRNLLFVPRVPRTNQHETAFFLCVSTAELVKIGGFDERYTGDRFVDSELLDRLMNESDLECFASNQVTCIEIKEAKEEDVHPDEEIFVQDNINGPFRNTQSPWGEVDGLVCEASYRKLTPAIVTPLENIK